MASYRTLSGLVLFAAYASAQGVRSSGLVTRSMPTRLLAHRGSARMEKPTDKALTSRVPKTQTQELVGRNEGVKEVAEGLRQRFSSLSNPGTVVSFLILASLLHGVPAHALDIFDDDWIRNFKVDVAGIEIDHRFIVESVVAGQFVGFIGALVGGRAAKQRKDEVEKLAQQLKELNIKLRNKARASRPRKKLAEDKDPQHERILGYLRMGKRTLKDQNGEAALSAFQKAMDSITEAKRAGPYENPQVERKAHRGMGAANVLLGNYPAALEHMNKVVALSTGKDATGLGDAYGVIADIYTEMGDFAKAADYYDLYMKAIVEDQEYEVGDSEEFSEQVA